MSSPRNNFLGSLVKRLEQMVCLYQCDDDLTFLACPPPMKFHIVVVAEAESGEKTEYKVAIYEAPQPGGPVGVPSAETSAGEPRLRRISEHTAITKSTIPRDHTLVPVGSPLKRGAPDTERHPKRPRYKHTAATTTTRAALEPLNVNTISTSRPHTKVAPKPKSAPSTAPSRTTKEVTDIAEDDNEQVDPPEGPCNDKDLYGMLMETVTCPHVFEDHFRAPLRLRGKKMVEEEITNKAVDIIERNKQLDDKTILGRLSWISHCIELAHLVDGELQRQGSTFDSKRSRKPRGKPKYGKWDVNGRDFTKFISGMFQLDRSKIHDADARRFMSETQKAIDFRPPGNYEMTLEALNLWPFGRKFALLFQEGGPGAIWFAALGPRVKSRYSVKEEFRLLTLCHKDFLDGDKKAVRFNRNMFTAYADASYPHWRTWMEEVGIPIDAAVDPPRVRVNDLFYRGGFNEGTKTYNVELFTPNEIKTYITNRTIGDGSSGIPGWEKHVANHNAWFHKEPCCAVWNKPPIQVYETEIPELGKGLMATKTLYPGDYVAEHAGVCKPAAQCTKDGDEGGNEKDRMELKIPGRGKFYIYTDTISGYTKYINDFDNPNIEWVLEENSGAHRIFLRVKEGCIIKPGDELTADYGPEYWEGKQKYNGPRFLLH